MEIEGKVFDPVQFNKGDCSSEAFVLEFPVEYTICNRKKKGFFFPTIKRQKNLVTTSGSKYFNCTIVFRIIAMCIKK